MKDRQALFLIFLFIFIAYSNSFIIPFHWDDYNYIVNNIKVKDAGELFKNWNGSRFVGFLSLWLNFFISGLRPAPFHLVNLLIHILNTFLIFFLIRLLLRLNFHDTYKDYENWISFGAALLFGLHPVNTMAVDYICQRFTLLATLFYLLTVFLYLKARTQSSKSSIFYLLAIISSIFAMKTKEITFTLPFTVLLLEILFFKKPRPCLYLIPLLLTIFIIPLGRIDALWDIKEQSLFRKTAETFDIPRHIYLFTEFRVLLTYMRLLILPVNLNIDYDYPLSKSLFEPDTFLAFIIHIILLGLAIILLKRSGRGRITGLGVLWYYITLSVESSIIPITDVIFEYRLYLPFTGFLLFLIGSVLWLIPVWRYRRQLMVFFFIVFILLGMGTFMRNSVWSSTRSLWEDAVKKSPNKIRTRLNYAATLSPEEAIKELEWVLSKDPWNLSALNKLARIFLEMGRVSEAQEILKKSSGIASEEETFSYMADVCLAKKDYSCAIDNINKLIELEPGSSLNYFRLGVAFEGLGKLDEAEGAYRKAIGLDPFNVDALNNLGNLMAIRGNLKESLNLLKKAKSLMPESPSILLNLGVTYAQLGDYDEALRHIDGALKLNPNLAEAWFNKGLILLQAGMKDEAYIAIKKSLDIAPDFEKAKEVLRNWK